jgi:hypothetical protein
MIEQCKQRQVDILTKSSLRLPNDRTVVYIHRGLRDHEQDMETNRIAKNRSEANGMEWRNDESEWNHIERQRKR